MILELYYGSILRKNSPSVVRSQKSIYFKFFVLPFWVGGVRIFEKVCSSKDEDNARGDISKTMHLYCHHALLVNMEGKF